MVAVFLSGVRGAAQPGSQTGQDLLQAHISGRGVIQETSPQKVPRSQPVLQAHAGAPGPYDLLTATEAVKPLHSNAPPSNPAPSQR